MQFLTITRNISDKLESDMPDFKADGRNANQKKVNMILNGLINMWMVALTKVFSHGCVFAMAIRALRNRS